MIFFLIEDYGFVQRDLDMTPGVRRALRALKRGGRGRGTPSHLDSSDSAPSPQRPHTKCDSDEAGQRAFRVDLKAIECTSRELDETAEKAKSDAGSLRQTPIDAH